MTDHVILRHAKLKTFGEIGGSLDHTYRLIDTPNADSSRLNLNENDFDKKVDVVAAIKNRIDQRVKQRPDNVLCIEYLITASPQWTGFGTDKETEFFEIAKQHLKDKYGEKNVISSHIHRDETTPHLVVYIVPFDEEKQALNCKKWIGNRTLLQEEQTQIAEKVAHLDLTRGIKNSKAEHRTIKQHYEIINQINEINEFSPNLDNLPEPTVAERFAPKKYAERVIESILPDYKKSKIEAIQNITSKKEVEAMREIAEKAEPYLNAINMIPDYRVNYLNKKINEFAVKIAEYEKAEDNKLIKEYNKKIEEFDKHKKKFESFYEYCNSELTAKNNNEKPLDKKHKKTSKWLKNSNLTDREIEKGWGNDGSKIHIDKPDFYISEYNYNSLMIEYYNNYKNNIYKKSEELNINESISILKDDSENQIGKRFQNKLDYYYENFETVIDEKSNDLQKENTHAENEKNRESHRIAQQAIRDKKIKEGGSAYEQQKRAENRAYRENGEHNQTRSSEKSNDRNIERDNDFSM
jgi:hypothetical protein